MLFGDEHVRRYVETGNLNARARTATPEEKPALGRKMTATWPQYDEYQQ
jgi:hypothetical protein